MEPAHEPFVKRAGFTLMAGLAVADKRAPDERFAVFLADLAATADDDRPLVRKGASWALRQIGKRNATLHARAVATALALHVSGGRGARWVADDALRELRSPKVRARIAERAVDGTVTWLPGQPTGATGQVFAFRAPALGAGRP